jgi:hypothetical protein
MSNVNVARPFAKLAREVRREREGSLTAGRFTGIDLV